MSYTIERGEVTIFPMSVGLRDEGWLDYGFIRAEDGSWVFFRYKDGMKIGFDPTGPVWVTPLKRKFICPRPGDKVFFLRVMDPRGWIVAKPWGYADPRVAIQCGF